MMTFWNRTINKLESGRKLYIMVVVRSESSSPGKAGFKMAVAEDGDIWGSIGGGAMEYRLTEQCRRLIKQNETFPFIQKQDHHPNSQNEGSGMICSGVQWVAFYPLDKKNLELAKQINAVEAKNYTKVVNYTETGIVVSEPEAGENYPVSITKEISWRYAEQPGVKNQLFIFGAGHVSLALSRLVKEIGFEITLFDNRKRINTFEENTFADKKMVIDYADAGQYIPEGNNIYVVIMTFAHQSDMQVLKQMMSKKIKYLGMMGSELKVKTVFETLLKEGYPKNTLHKTDAPVGLPINSITPAEIAVSIVAKIIKVKNGDTDGEQRML